MSVIDDLVICETIHAITTHLRRVTPDHPIRLSGHASPKPKTLCGRDVGWDTQLPVHSVKSGAVECGCRSCMLALRGP